MMHFNSIDSWWACNNNSAGAMIEQPLSPIHHSGTRSPKAQPRPAKRPSGQGKHNEVGFKHYQPYTKGERQKGENKFARLKSKIGSIFENIVQKEEPPSVSYYEGSQQDESRSKIYEDDSQLLSELDEENGEEIHKQPTSRKYLFFESHKQRKNNRKVAENQPNKIVIQLRSKEKQEVEQVNISLSRKGSDRSQSHKRQIIKIEPQKQRVIFETQNSNSHQQHYHSVKDNIAQKHHGSSNVISHNLIQPSKLSQDPNSKKKLSVSKTDFEVTIEHVPASKDRRFSKRQEKNEFLSSQSDYLENGMRRMGRLQPLQITERGSSKHDSALQTIYLDPKPPINFNMDKRRRLRTEMYTREEEKAKSPEDRQFMALLRRREQHMGKRVRGNNSKGTFRTMTTGAQDHMRSYETIIQQNRPRNMTVETGLKGMALPAVNQSMPGKHEYDYWNNSNPQLSSPRDPHSAGDSLSLKGSLYEAIQAKALPRLNLAKIKRDKHRQHQRLKHTLSPKQKYERLKQLIDNM